VLIYNEQENYSAKLRSALLGIEGVNIVAEVDELTLLEQAVHQFPAEIVLIHLDPQPDTVLPVVVKIAGAKPERAVLTISKSHEGKHILTAVRAGVREFLTKPIDEKELAEAVEKVRSQLSNAVQLGKLISVMGTIGGAGASSLAANIAVELCDLSVNGAGSVALVDMDFRYGQLATMLDLQPDYTLSDLCHTMEQLDVNIVKRAMAKHKTGVHLLARPHHFSQADQITAADCASVLGSLQQLYEYVVVDGPNRCDPGGLAVLDRVDVSIVVMQLLVTSVRNSRRMIEGLMEHGFNLDKFKLVCNQVGRESAHLEVSQVEQNLEMKFLHNIPDDWKTMGSAINMGSSLKEFAPKTRLRMAIRELAKKLSGKKSNDAGHVSERAGLLNRIISSVS
jgi:pilus assembly protein CpaE